MSYFHSDFVTLGAPYERGKVIDCGVHIIILNIQPFSVEYRYILNPR